MRRKRKKKRERELTCSAIANQESLSILEVEMRKLEAVTKEIVDELGYLQRREMRMRDTNGGSFFLVSLYLSSFLIMTAKTYEVLTEHC